MPAVKLTGILMTLGLLLVRSVGAADSFARTPEGRPNLEGIWQSLSTAVWNLEDHPAELGVPAGTGVVVGGKIPYKDSALAQRHENYRQRSQKDPEANCFMVGVPRINYKPYPFQIVQTSKQIFMLHEYVHTSRTVHLDGSSHPLPDYEWWMGDSRGYWEGDTLVVDVTNFTPNTWFDRSGNFHSASLHVVERYTPHGPNHILYRATIEDPEVFSRPWEISLILYRRLEPGLQVLEYECYAYKLMDSAVSTTEQVDAGGDPAGTAK